MRNFQCHYRVWWCSNWILWIRSDQEITTDHKLSEAPNSLQLLSLWCIWGPVSVNILLLRRRKISWPGSLFSIWEVSVFFVSISRSMWEWFCDIQQSMSLWWYIRFLNLLYKSPMKTIHTKRQSNNQEMIKDCTSKRLLFTMVIALDLDDSALLRKRLISSQEAIQILDTWNSQYLWYTIFILSRCTYNFTL